MGMESLRDHDDGFFAAGLQDLLPQARLRVAVDEVERLVEDDHVRVGGQAAQKLQLFALAAGQVAALLFDGNIPQSLRRFDGRPRAQKVVEPAALEDERVGRNQQNAASKKRFVKVFVIKAVIEQLAGGRGQQLAQNARQRRFAASVFAENQHPVSAMNGEGEVVQNLLLVIRTAKAAHLQRFKRRQGSGADTLGFAVLLVQLGQAIQRNLFQLIFLREGHKAVDVAPQGGKVHGEGGYGADGHGAVEHAQTAYAIDEGIREVHHARDQQVIVEDFDLRALFLSGSEPLHNFPRAPDEEVLGVSGAQRFAARIAFVRYVVQLLGFVQDDGLRLSQPWKHGLRRQNQQEDDGDDDERQRPVDAQQIDEHGDCQKDVGRERNEIVERQPLHAVDVAFQKVNIVSHAVLPQLHEWHEQHILQHAFVAYGRCVRFGDLFGVGTKDERQYKCSSQPDFYPKRLKKVAVIARDKRVDQALQSDGRDECKRFMQNRQEQVEKQKPAVMLVEFTEVCNDFPHMAPCADAAAGGASPEANAAKVSASIADSLLGHFTNPPFI